MVDREHAIQTTQYVLVTFAKLMAPITPFFAEYLYLRIRDPKIDTAVSVHLSPWPHMPTADTQLIEGMAKTRKVIEMGLALRSKAGIKARQPLRAFTYNGSEFDLSQQLEEIVKDEMNVKSVVRGTDIVLDTEVTEELKVEGVLRDILRSVQEKRKEANLEPKDEIEMVVATTDVSQAEKYITGYTDLPKKASVQKISFNLVAETDDVFTGEKFELVPGVFVSCHITSTKQKHI